MSVKVQDFLKNEKLPAFLVNHPVWKSINKIDKVFPRLGLSNCSDITSLDNSEIAKRSAYNLLEAIHNILAFQRSFLEIKKTDLVGKRDKIEEWQHIIHQVIRQIDSGHDGLIHSFGGKITLKLRQEINTDIRKDERLFRVYNKIYDGLKSLRIGSRMPKLDTIPAFKEFSSNNVPTQNYSVVFSSDGLDGLWDIATMSMRGIKSCQSWTSKSKYKTNIIGSIVDPFTGVIYLTTGKNINHLGTKMINRCVVRLVVNKTTRKPSIIIDRMYPDYNEQVGRAFVDFLSRKTDNKLDVSIAAISPYDKLQEMYYPHSQVHDKLTKTTKSYIDTKSIISDDINQADNKPLAPKQRLFSNMLYAAACDAMSQDPTAKMIRDILTISRSKSKQVSLFTIIGSGSPANLRYLLANYYNSLALDIIKITPSLPDANEYSKQLCFRFLQNKQHKQTLSMFVRNINHYFSFSRETRVDSRIVSKLLNALEIEKQVNTTVKKHLRSIIVAGK